MYLLDTNVVSELRKAKSGKADAKVTAWAAEVPASELFLSAISVLELEMGVLLVERRDPLVDTVRANMLAGYALIDDYVARGVDLFALENVGLLLEINEIGLPCATEFLDTITPQYTADLIAWGAIGARTTESQVHRELASGLSCPVGFKNGTDGNVRIAIDAIRAAQSPHHFLSVTKAGHSAIVSTTGNEDCHLIMRGGKAPNYDATSVDAACKELAASGLQARLMVDFSHANSSKQFKRQVDVARDVAEQMSKGEERIIGVMVESHIKEGRQDLKPGVELEYGKSITDACIGWEDSLTVLDVLAEAVRQRRVLRAAQE